MSWIYNPSKGRFETKHQKVPLNEKKKSTIAKIKEKLNQIHQTFGGKPTSIFKRFKKWQSAFKVDISGSKIWSAALAFLDLETSKISATSKRTYYGQIISGVASEREEKLVNCKIGRRIKRELALNTHGQLTKKAMTFHPDQLAQMFQGVNLEIAWLLFLTCSRVGNGSGFVLKRVRTRQEEDFRWAPLQEYDRVMEIVWVAHKTARLIGAKKTRIPLPPSLNCHKLIPLSKTQIDLFRLCIPKGYSEHSFRRSGAQHLRRLGCPLEEIQLITLHTSTASLLDYLD